MRVFFYSYGSVLDCTRCQGLMLESFWGGLGHSLRLPESVAGLVVGHRKSYSLRRARRGGFEHLDSNVEAHKTGPVSRVQVWGARPLSQSLRGFHGRRNTAA